VDSVVLHHAGLGYKRFEEEGDQRQLVLLCEVPINPLKLADIVGPVISRQRHAGENHGRPRCLKTANHLFEVGARDLDGKAAQPIVASKFEQHNFRFRRDRLRHPCHAARRGVATNARIYYSIAVTLLIQGYLHEIGIGLAGFHSKTRRERIAEAKDHRPSVGWWLRLCAGPGGRRRRLS